MAVTNNRFFYLCLNLASIFGLSGLVIIIGQPSFAQSNIVPDNTLGAESSQVITNFNGEPIEIIQGGAARGINLFQSFQEFNVSERRGTYFLTPNVNIKNILTRVTGRKPSEILGTLGTFGESESNLFLINPNGIIFGKNASLNVQGSFVVTTANELHFGNQGNFSATNPQVPAVLNINPSAFLFNQINQAASIQNNAVEIGLQVPESRSLLLVGGNVNMDGGILFAPGGRVELGGLAEIGSVGIQQDSNIFSLKFPSQVQRASVLLNNSAGVGVIFGGGGSLENSRISANSDNFRGGRVRINAQGVFVGTKPSDVSKYITASSGVGLSGTVDVNSLDNSSLQNSLTEFPQNFIDTNALIANSCITRVNQRQEGSFVITGSGALPNRPGDTSASNYATGSVRNITESRWKKGDPIIEATGVYRLADGRLVMSRQCW